MRYSKTLADLAKNDDRIEEYHFDTDVHWLYCAPGWLFSESLTRTNHEWTVKDVLSVYRFGIEKGVIENGNTYPLDKQSKAA